MLGRPQVVEALRKVDNNILKLDSAIERTVQLLDRPSLSYRLPKVIEQLAQFSGSGIIQTMITRGTMTVRPSITVPTKKLPPSSRHTAI